jgi:hypothetical protein
MAAFTRRQYAGSAVATTITAGINTTDTTCSLAATTGWPGTAGVSFYVVIDPGTSTEEKCSATISGSTLTLVRGQDDTSASSHASGASIYPVFTANDADEANEVVSKLTTKGDLLVTTGSALNRLAVGTNDYSLLADSSATNGVAWKQIPAAGIATDAVTTAKIIDNAVTKAKVADRAVGSAELDGISVNAGTTSAYTFVAGDANRVITFSATTTATIPASTFSVGDQINILQTGAGQVTVVAGAGVTLQKEASRVKTRAQYAMATVICIATNEWVVLGNVVA